ncbi:glycoside hydrolase family 3 C-terminal domain-containing protein [Pseudofrankia sp. BMG5.36]|uniref:beta-glucosidase family protein n=1 Tax=Pseudofrankia sp. BMG5.36 TaxID=1834512 RepID=UPI0008DA814F|nr:glycoside hydrolase family 3 C-terminal domain-containing protein [Pseudofrankia sp. BMG5.36]OHV65195.1 glycosyl hydrolase [Pseudofrankia sp. BMG5.36]
MNGGAARADVAGAGVTGTADVLEKRVAEALARLDLEARVRLLTGASFWRTWPSPEAGLRAMVLSDGPAGVRGERADEREPSANLPCPSALAATWDEPLLRRVGRLLAAQARAKGVDVVLGPTVNLHRSPLGGRHFECLSEDPLLTARLGAALVRGIQAGGVAATVKHYVANESETDRFTVDVRVDERALREVYLAPFEALVCEAGVWAVMAAYNSVGGATMTENPLLRGPLKDEWGFDGLVVSDWIATRSTVPSALAGLDLVMPGPWGPWGPALVAAVRDGSVPAELVEDKARRLLRLAARVGALADPARPDQAAGAEEIAGGGDRAGAADGTGADGTGADGTGADGTGADGTGADGTGADPAGPYARDLLRRAAAGGMVLLRNEGGLLPLTGAGAPGASGGTRRVAVIGPNATLPRGQGGGSATVFPPYLVGPADGLRAALGEGGEVVTATGVRAEPWPAPLSTAGARDPESGEPGLRVRFFDAAGKLLRSERRLSGRLMFMDDPVLASSARVEVTALLTARASGHHPLGFAGMGRFSLRARVGAAAAGGTGTATATGTGTGTETVLYDDTLEPPDGDIVAAILRPPVWWAGMDLTAGEDVLVTLRHDPPAGMPVASFALLGEDPSPPGAEELETAVELAASADVAVVVVGTSDRVESEGVDRAGLDLPTGQNELVRRVAAANPRTVVVVNAGAPVLLPWREEVPAVLLSWFPGQEFGAALADVLLGRVEPGGRLPTSWPARAEDCPAWSVTPVDGALDYDEGLHVGYRGWSRRTAAASPDEPAAAEGSLPAAPPQGGPAYPFGHGIGYTTWVYESLAVPAAVAPGEAVRVRVTVRNSGDRPGRTVVQAYLSREDSAVERPALWLAGFATADVAPGEKATISVEIAPRAFQYWRPATDGDGPGGWSTEPGTFTLRVGPSSATLTLRGAVAVVTPS